MRAIRKLCHALLFVGLALLAQNAVAQKLSTSTRLYVRGFHFKGNTAFPSEVLAKITQPYTNREITSEELEDARRAITLYYINHGYLNSGAVIPDQTPKDGVVTIDVVEGVLSRIELHGNKWLRDDYITGRLQRGSGPPLDMNKLKESLQVLRQNPNVKQLNAELEPGKTPGESILDLRVVDQQPFRAGLQIDNHRPPSVGAEEISLLASDLNLTGHSDPLEVTYGIANAGENDGWGFSVWDNVAGNYALPLNSYNTTLGLRASRQNTSLVENPFTPLNVNSETVDLGVVLRQPVYETANREVAVAIAFDQRQNNSTLLGQPFDISPGAVNGRMTVAVLGLSQEFIDRGQDHVLALRSTFNFGLDVLGATDNGVAGDPDGNFFAWLGQAQYVRRLFNTQSQLILRVAGQWTDDKLLALEQMSVGGADTVRGYLENQLVRDRGIASSAEFRIPVLLDKAGNPLIQLAPFFDFGGAWNVGDSQGPNTIYSVGMGLLVSPNKHINGQLYWGYRLNHVSVPYNNAQDLGLDFQMNIMAF
jgi:hemolysin activation/secretion protein